ncbi:hypothetical protein E3N88_46195 [Mikania micrantha]|uniref:Ubiquitin-like modifier-activating enzyme 5 n=1 Tax=Mikania micrantha TaxID=192012 RepID=A0A5N6L6W8_9ASTR|nr:hypothetical protein E3N88_46195 [Mikania micrantha]
MEAELKGMLSDLQNLKSSLSDPSHQASVDHDMSAEVVDSNPYSRLMALQRMGIVENYESIRGFQVLVGGWSVAAEMLTRCGIGRLLLYDYDTVELANMNRLFFRPEQVGMTKTDAAVQTLSEINPDVVLELSSCPNFYRDCGTDECWVILKEDGVLWSRWVWWPAMVLVVACYGKHDGDEEKVVLANNGGHYMWCWAACYGKHVGDEEKVGVGKQWWPLYVACNELNQIWMELVVWDAVSGHIQLLIPGETACFACAPPLNLGPERLGTKRLDPAQLYIILLIFEKKTRPQVLLPDQSHPGSKGTSIQFLFRLR